MVKWLDNSLKKAVSDAVQTAERGTRGEIRVHVTEKVRRTALEDAKELFWKLGMHLTRERTGVLIFVAWKSHEFAILGDEGIDHLVGDSFWKEVCDKMRDHFSRDDRAGGLVAAVHLAGEKLALHFPARHDDRNELSNEISEG